MTHPSFAKDGCFVDVYFVELDQFFSVYEFFKLLMFDVNIIFEVYIFLFIKFDVMG